MNDRVSTPGSSSGHAPRIFIISGPGGVGKGTIVDALMSRDPRLLLSRSWTTRAQRPGERDDAYVFTTRDSFEFHRESGGFLEWTEFLGNYYGTPVPDLSAGRDIVLEIEVDGAQQVKVRHPESVLIFILPPPETNNVDAWWAVVTRTTKFRSDCERPRKRNPSGWLWPTPPWSTTISPAPSTNWCP